MGSWFGWTADLPSRALRHLSLSGKTTQDFVPAKCFGFGSGIILYVATLYNNREHGFCFLHTSHLHSFDMCSGLGLAFSDVPLKE